MAKALSCSAGAPLNPNGTRRAPIPCNRSPTQSPESSPLAFDNTRELSLSPSSPTLLLPSTVAAAEDPFAPDSPPIALPPALASPPEYESPLDFSTLLFDYSSSSTTSPTTTTNTMAPVTSPPKTAPVVSTSVTTSDPVLASYGVDTPTSLALSLPSPSPGPESLNRFSFFSSALPPLALQLLIDAAAFPSSRLADGSRTTRPIVLRLPDFMLANGTKVARMVQGSEFHIRAKAVLGTVDDWGDEDETDWSNLPGPFGGQLIRSPKFFNKTQGFCVGYRDGRQIPALPTLSRYASLATSFLLNSLPIIHRPTLFSTEMTPQIAFALAVAGAGLEADGVAFYDNMVKEKRIFAIHHMHELDLTPEESMSSVQSLAIYHYLGLFHEDPQQRNYSAAAHATLISVFRYHDFPSHILATQWTAPTLTASPEEIETSWKKWILLETLTRISFMVYLLDLTMSNTFEASPMLATSELPINLPSSEALWNAPTAQAWHNLLFLPQLSTPPPNFLRVIDLLLTPKTGSSGSSTTANRDRELILSQLPSLAPIALTILRETLTRMENGLRKQGSDLSHLSKLDGRDSPEVALRKVQNGTRVLELVAGGCLSKGPWFMPVRPIFQ
ncbi:hypothetical protein T439DRAFT_356791 [Meredithblackwellia eburnea MCA 4105]